MIPDAPEVYGGDLSGMLMASAAAIALLPIGTIDGARYLVVLPMNYYPPMMDSLHSIRLGMSLGAVSCTIRRVVFANEILGWSLTGDCRRRTV